MDDFFSIVSKAVIVIPVLLTGVVLIYFFGSSTKPAPIAGVIPTVMPQPTAVLPTQSNSFKFDLVGPIVCENLFIKDKKVFYKNNQNNYLLNGDCLYQWQTGKFNGAKKCGLGTYINMAENYAGMLNISDLLGNSTIAGLAKSKGISLVNVLSTCKKEKIKDETVLKIPANVLFKNN